MKKLLLLLLCTSCCLIDEYPPSLYIFHAKPNIEYDIFPSDGLIYHFDEEIEYEVQDTLYADIYRNGMYYLTKQCDTSYIPVSNKDEMKVVISNLKLEGGKYFRIKDQEVDGFKFLKNYPYHFTTNEAYIGEQSFPINVYDYAWEHHTDHCYTQIPVKIKPVTHYYVIQLIADDPTVICDSLIVSGLAYRYDIRNQLVTNDLCNSLLPLYDKQVRNNYTIYASKFSSFGVPTDNSSWNTIESDKVYVAFKVVSSSKYLLVDVSQRIYQLPKGGVITIFVDTSKVDTSSDFIVEIDDWDTHIIDIEF